MYNIMLWVSFHTGSVTEIIELYLAEGMWRRHHQTSTAGHSGPTHSVRSILLNGGENLCLSVMGCQHV
jgi:hypothetical protein